MSRIVKDGTTVVFQREIPSTCGGGSASCLDANGQPLRVNGPTNDTSETFTYDADRYFLTSADPVSYGTTSPYKEQDWAYTAGALGLRDTYKDVFPPYFHWHLATNTYATGTSRVTETLSAEYDSTGTPNPEYDFKRAYGYAANGAIETLTAYRRPTGQTTGWESQGTFNLTLDDEGRHSALMGAYTYDHRWLRTRRVFSSNPLDFWHGGDGALVMELDCPAGGSCVYCNESTADGGTPTCAESRPSQEYVWLDGAPIAMIEADLRWNGTLDDTNATVKYIHPGLLGEPRRVTDSAKNVVWTRDIPAFGYAGDVSGNQQTVGSVTTTLNLGLPGQYQEPEGVYYNWHRFYDSQAGAYWSADPLVGLGSTGQPGRRLDSFAYASMRPSSFVDRTGLDYYTCTKPLDAASGERAGESYPNNTKSGWDVSWNPAFHEYVCVPSADGAECGGLTADGPVAPGKPSRDRYVRQRCTRVKSSRCMEDCLREKIRSPERPYYLLIGSNCQNWVTEKLRECRWACLLARR